MSADLQSVLQDIEAAQERLRPVLYPTHLIKSDFFSAQSGNHVFLKPENLQRTGAFKIRGAFNMIAQLTEEKRQRGIITASAGNHAQGVGFSAQYFNCPCTIVMPFTTPLLKVNVAKEKGATVILHGSNYDEAYSKALELAETEGMSFVHAYDTEDVYKGQGTISLEILEERPDIDIILVPIGGGGLIAGMALAAKAMNPSIRIVGVEPVGAAGMKNSVTAGEPVTLKQLNTCAEGVAVRTVGTKTLAVCNEYVDEIVTVSEKDIMETVVLLMERHKLVVETSGAISVAALRKLNCINKNIACVLSGGNIDTVTISSLITKSSILQI